MRCSSLRDKPVPWKHYQFCYLYVGDISRQTLHQLSFILKFYFTSNICFANRPTFQTVGQSFQLTYQPIKRFSNCTARFDFRSTGISCRKKLNVKNVKRSSTSVQNVRFAKHGFRATWKMGRPGKNVPILRTARTLPLTPSFGSSQKLLGVDSLCEGLSILRVARKLTLAYLQELVSHDWIQKLLR